MSRMVIPTAQSGYFNSAVAATLRAEAAVKHKSHKDLAQDTGLAPKTVSRYLLAQRVIPIDAVFLFAVALGTTPSELARMAEERMLIAPERDEVVMESTRPVDEAAPVGVDVTAGSWQQEFDRRLAIHLELIENSPGLTKRQKGGMKSHARRAVLAEMPVQSPKPKRRRTADE